MGHRPKDGQKAQTKLHQTSAERIPRDVVPDMPDRIIAATALTHDLPPVTADGKIRASRIPTIW
jgi:predicted nucleic acid-binding protein